ncbi:MAG: acetyl-CoA C-acetyltransferase [Gammaproteobacteria bacterium]|nr:acetyl-CoA C-acetyltransferase [Gammaproteobacteria bacterium]
MALSSNLQGNKVFIVDGARTPFLKAKGKPGAFVAADLAVSAARPLVDRMPFDATAFDEVIMGCVMPNADEANIARILALRIGCGERTPAWTVQRNCASGMQALDCAAQNIATGRSDLILAGGVESMSHAPILLNLLMVNWLADFSRAKTAMDKIKMVAKLRGPHLKPIIGLLRGLTDPTNGLSMGQTAENLAHRFHIDRVTMDTYSMHSHHRLAKAQDEGYLADEIVDIFDSKGNLYKEDDGVRRDSDLPGLAKLKPVFDRHFGKVTAGNSAQVTDGAAVLILASEKAVRDHKLPVLARITDAQWSGLDPAEMGLGPAYAMTPILDRNKLSIKDVDYWEINEAFATQVLACREAWMSEQYCRDFLGRDKPIGEIPMDRLNVDGGGVSVGHPVGASGARITLHLAHILKRTNSKRGIASLCIGGGQGGALLIERE